MLFHHAVTSVMQPLLPSLQNIDQYAILSPHLCRQSVRAFYLARSAFHQLRRGRELATIEYPTLDDVEAYWSKAVGEVPSHGEAPKDLGHEFREDQPYERHSWGTWLEFKGLDGLPFWCYWQSF